MKILKITFRMQENSSRFIENINTITYKMH